MNDRHKAQGDRFRAPALLRQPDRGHTARDYGRNAEPLPDLHVVSRLSELDADYAAELAARRARHETLEREILELATRLAAPLAGIDAASGKRS